MKWNYLNNVKSKFNLIFLFITIYFVFCSFFVCYAGNSCNVSTTDTVKVEVVSGGGGGDTSKSNVKVKSENLKVSDLDKMQINVPEPANLKDVIILDAGHGYSDPGGGFGGYYEYEPNAQLIYKLANYLVDTNFFEVYITHSLDYAGDELVFDVKKNPNHKYVHIILPEIKPIDGKKSKVGNKNYSKKYDVNFLQAAMIKTVDILRKSRSKIYSICLHHNVGNSKKNLSESEKKDGSIVGMRLFYNSKKKNQKNYNQESVNFCKEVLGLCKNIYGDSNVNNQICDSNFAVTKIGCPAILCEVDFIDNLKRQKVISNKKDQNRMARALKNAILKTYGYQINWAKVSCLKNNETGDIKIIVKNLPKSQDNTSLKMAAYGAVNSENGGAIWFDFCKEGDDLVCNLNSKFKKNDKLCVDLYEKTNDNLKYVDSDFDEFEV